MQGSVSIAGKLFTVIAERDGKEAGVRLEHDGNILISYELDDTEVIAPSGENVVFWTYADMLETLKAVAKVTG